MSVEQSLVVSDSKEQSYWFEAKSYGIGWTLPVTWQGWVTVLIYIGLLVAGLSALPTPMTRLIHVVLVSLLLVAVVIWKGERPVRWRWGRH